MMNQETINFILQRMVVFLDNAQAKGYLGRDSQAGRHNPVVKEF